MLPRHETIRRFDDAPVSLGRPFSGGRPQIRHYPEQQRGVSLYPSVALNTVMSSTRRRAHVFPGRPGPGFSPLVQNITRRLILIRSDFARCTAPAKRGRRLRIAVSVLSRCALLRAMAYDMRGWVRCRRREPTFRRRSSRCALWTTAKCYAARVHVTHPHSRVSIASDFSMCTFSVNEAVSISYSST